MNPHLRSAAKFLLAGSLLFVPVAKAAAASEAAALVAAMTLSDQLNYTWSRSISLANRVNDIEGRIVKSGHAIVTMPMGPYLRLRIMGGASDGTDDPELMIIFKGGDRCVVKTPHGWLTPTEVNALPVPLRRRGAPRSAAEGALSFSITFPHEEVAMLVANYTTLTTAPDGAIEGGLSETGAKLLLLPANPGNVAVRHAAGMFKLWVKDGRLAKYEIQLKGSLARVGDAVDKERGISQIITTVLKDVGTTKVDLPDEARQKLGN